MSKLKTADLRLHFFFALRTNTPFLASIAMHVVTMLEMSIL